MRGNEATKPLRWHEFLLVRMMTCGILKPLAVKKPPVLKTTPAVRAKELA